MKRLIAILVFAVVGHALAQDDLVEYAEDREGGTYYYYRSRVKEISRGYEVWIKSAHLPPAKTASGKPYAWAILRYKIDCFANTLARQQSTLYEASGAVLDTSDTPRAASQVVPESMGEALLKAICSLGRRGGFKNDPLAYDLSKLEEIYPNWAEIMGSPSYAAWLQSRPAAYRKTCSQTKLWRQAAECLERFLRTQ